MDHKGNIETKCEEWHQKGFRFNFREVESYEGQKKENLSLF